MKQFICLADVESAGLPHSLGSLIENILKVELSIAKPTVLDPDDGAIYLLEKDDTDPDFVEQFGRPFSAIPFESIQHLDTADSYLCRFLRGNQCCITLVLPNREWIPEPWRAIIKEELP